MVIRTFKRQRNLKKNITIIIIFLLGIFIVSKLSTKIYDTIISINSDLDYKIGNSLNFGGEITIENNFPLYTHKITNQEGEKIFIKSNNINLNNYSGNLEIFGEINDIKRGIPIIETKSIKFPEKGLIIKDGVYFFVKDMLYIDFSDQTILSANKSEKEIEIFYNNEKILSIERFLCNMVLRQKDCSYLIEDYGSTQKENFDSYRGHTYYKHGTGTRTVFDGTMFGYIFKDVEETTILNISSIIRVVDKNFILTNKREEILENCKNQGLNINQIGVSNIEYQENNKISITVKESINETGCKITFDMRNEWKITEKQIIEKENSL